VIRGKVHTWGEHGSEWLIGALRKNGLSKRKDKKIESLGGLSWCRQEAGGCGGGSREAGGKGWGEMHAVPIKKVEGRFES